MVALVSHHDDVHVGVLGTMAFDNPKSIKRDTIFRIASLTKLITAVAAMILVEECKIRLDDSIEPWLPALANRRVLKSITSNLDDTVPALVAVTLRDLLTYRMGFGSIMAMPDTYPIQSSEPPFESGGGGLVSTIDDYFVFCRMMLNKGRYVNEQILSSATVELMTSDQLTPEHREDCEIFFDTHSSWGLGFAADIGRKEI